MHNINLQLLQKDFSVRYICYSLGPHIKERKRLAAIGMEKLLLMVFKYEPFVRF